MKVEQIDMVLIELSKELEKQESFWKECLQQGSLSA
jgi:hypothetical protein